MSITLKANTYLTLEETKDWLGIKSTDSTQDEKVKRLINSACAKAETYIDGPVKSKQFTEVRDGTNSNSIVPSHWPIVSLDELRIDYNRGFDDTTVIDLSHVLVRGSPDRRQLSDDNPIRIVGTDVVLWDDKNTLLLGRLFSGSIVQSMQLKYTAGWGADADDIPSDLSHATLMIVEYLYYLNANKDMGITGRTSLGQSYTRHRQGSARNGAADPGLPPEITSMLDPFKDSSLGIADSPQRNTFT